MIVFIVWIIQKTLSLKGQGLLLLAIISLISYQHTAYCATPHVNTFPLYKVTLFQSAYDVLVASKE